MEHVRRFLDGTPVSIKGLESSDLPPSTAMQVFVHPTGGETEFTRTTAAAAQEIAPTFGFAPTSEVVLANGLTVRYGHPFGDPNSGIGFSITAGNGASVISSWVPPIVDAAGLLRWLDGFTWWFEGDDLNVRPGDQVIESTRWKPRVYQVVPDAGLLMMEIAGPARSSPTGSGMRVPGGLLYRRTVNGQVAHLILDGGDVLTKMIPLPTRIGDPASLIAEASRLVVHRA